jgi:hypothetical protein
VKLPGKRRSVHSFIQDNEHHYAILLTHNSIFLNERNNQESGGRDDTNVFEIGQVGLA